MEQKCNSCKKLLRFIISIVILLIIMNLVLISKMDMFKKKGKRFTYTDWVVLYNLCKTKETKEDILKLYWSKDTDFKEYLLSKK